MGSSPTGPTDVMSQDIEDTLNPHRVRVFSFWVSGFAGERAEQFAGGGVDHADLGLWD